MANQNYCKQQKKTLEKINTGLLQTLREKTKRYIRFYFRIRVQGYVTQLIKIMNNIHYMQLESRMYTTLAMYTFIFLLRIMIFLY